MSSQWAASALSWWVEAGVDTIVAEAPRDWLKSAGESPPAAEIAPAEAPLPDTLDAFRAWLMADEHIPYAAPSAPRVGPSGDPASGLMIMIDMPAAEDVEAGRLLAGEAGRLFDRMLAAIGRGRENIYLASLSPVRTPAGTFDAKSARRLAEIARHHIGLAAPKALLLFGDGCAKALLGDAVAGTRGRWHRLATPAGDIRTLATIRPHKLASQPALKKIAWEDLQMLMEGL